MIEDKRPILPLAQQIGLSYEEHLMLINGQWPTNKDGQRVGLRILGWRQKGENELECDFERVEENDCS